MIDDLRELPEERLEHIYSILGELKLANFQSETILD